ncbi:MAG: hypothetical protein CMJ58_15155 [Planctomycetaceae bacterium]|nr:hypothetical protein [Planctomycetaceae bacterium]
MYANVTDEPRQHQPQQPRDSEIRRPDEAWQVSGFPDLECSVWKTQSGTNKGRLYLDLRRVTREGKRLKTLRAGDIVGAFVGIAELALRLAGEETVPSAERARLGLLAEGAIQLVADVTPRPRRREQPQNRIFNVAR